MSKTLKYVLSFCQNSADSGGFVPKLWGQPVDPRPVTAPVLNVLDPALINKER